MNTDNPSISWNVTWGGSQDDFGQDVAVANDGSAYVVGYSYFGSSDFDSVLVKFAPNGTKLWDNVYGGWWADASYGVAIDANGFVYVAGSTLEFGTYDFELVKFAPNGTKLWGTSVWGSSWDDFVCDIAIAPDGSIYITGFIFTFSVGYELVLVKVAPNGTQLWNVIWGGPLDDVGNGVEVDADGFVYVTGYTASFGAGNSDLALIKFASNGTKLWNITWGGPLNEVGYGIAVDPTGSLYVAGTTPGLMLTDFALIKFASNGTKLWDIEYGESTAIGYGVAVDAAAGAIYATGYKGPAGGTRELMLVKVTPNGTKLWNGTWDGPLSDEGHRVAIDTNGSVYVAGYTTSFGAGGNDFVLVKFENFSNDNTPPTGYQDPATNITNVQNGLTIWVNGTAIDDSFGVASVTIQWSNHTGWSQNMGTTNSWAFYNTSPIREGIWEILVNITDYANNSAIITCQIFVDNVAPTGFQWINTSTPIIQSHQTIWINGTAFDLSPSSGIQSITLTSSNSSGGISDWSSVIIVGSNTSLLDFSFFNISPLADNQLNGCYEINVSIEDMAGNKFNLTCRVTVEIKPPTGTQDPATQAPTRGDVNGRIWVNGTVSDDGFGIASVTIQWSNHTGWSADQGDLSSWAFYNTSPMDGGLYEIYINMTDLANNSALLICYIYVDYIPPIGIQSNTTDLSSPQNGGTNRFIYVNGTASDRGGIGMQDVAIVWTNTSTSWSANIGTNESWSFYNTSAINNGIYKIIMTLTDKFGNAQNISCHIWIDTLAPMGWQDTTTQRFQTVDLNGFLWVNGSATDGDGSGFLTVFIQGSNVSGATWSSNLNSSEFWAFTNNSAIPDGIWEIYINITDRAFNSILLTAYLKIDTTPPSGAQDLVTAFPQKNDLNGRLWVNGTSMDGSGAGLQLVEVISTNSSATWSVNFRTNESWAFANTSAISDGTWKVVIQL
ncbi:MAG: SBBP repeat-containing protein, partial [Candidatus Helarchaeota archaeon]